MKYKYWKLGQRIVEEEQLGKSRAEYGSKLIENLSRYLTDTFGKGFSEANLKNMRRFYLIFPKLDTQCVANLSWTNLRTIIVFVFSRCHSRPSFCYFIGQNGVFVPCFYSMILPSIC